MNKEKVKNRFLSNQMLFIGMSLAGVYWLLDSFLSLFLSAEETLLERMIGLDLNEVWMRIIVLCLFAIFGSHAQYIMNERRRLAEKAERDAATRERFQRLLSPALAERVVSGALTVEKGGESVEATVLFADIRGFTAISENTDAAEVLQLLNEYYECIVDVVFKHEGTVDKFIGDAIMVIWGAPVRHHDAPYRAVKAALDIQHALIGFNHDRMDKGKPPIEVGIGINTGELVAGYIGSSRTMSYSVIGDTVNTASRLCSAAKPGQIIISESTSNALPIQIAVGPLDPLKAKGKYHPIEVFEVVGFR
ncbi:MAG: adenylate/guanylate cyclase domain-containing protein [Desulfosarcinaceae bacterium]|nr:adenylate/guanylate cyclase domain-containing protein [Desulfosarcinaceae bacterium]